MMTGDKGPTEGGGELGRWERAFLDDCEARNLTPATLHYYRQRLGIVLQYLAEEGVTDPADITPAHVRAFLRTFPARGRSPYYMHQFYRVLRRWCSFLVTEGVLADSPMRTIRPPRLPKDVLPPFSRADVHALLEACEYERDRAIVLTLLDTGVRAAELLALNVGDLDRTTGAVRVRMGKGRKDRTVFAGPVTLKALGRYLATREETGPGDPLFASLITEERRLTFGGLSTVLRRLGDRAGVRPIGAHRFRRTFAIESLRAGMALPQLAALMGHSGLQVLTRYLALVTDDLRTAHARYGAVDALMKGE